MDYDDDNMMNVTHMAIFTSSLNAISHTPATSSPYIMDSIPIVKRKDKAAHGTYRTKDTILQIYDQMQTAVATGTSYQTWLNPPPADLSCTHPPKG